MAQTKTILLPRQQRLLSKLGENIRLARLRRDLSAEQVAERAGIGRSTLTRLEQGNEGVSINIYIKVLTVLGLDDDIAKVAEDDIVGRRLQDAKLVTRSRASKYSMGMKVPLFLPQSFLSPTRPAPRRAPCINGRPAATLSSAGAAAPAKPIMSPKGAITHGKPQQQLQDPVE